MAVRLVGGSSVSQKQPHFSIRDVFMQYTLIVFTIPDHQGENPDLDGTADLEEPRMSPDIKGSWKLGAAILFAGISEVSPCDPAGDRTFLLKTWPGQALSTSDTGLGTPGPAAPHQG